MNSMIKLALAGLGLLLTMPVFAQQEATLKKNLEVKFPGSEISAVSKSPYFGLYEAMVGDRMVYTDIKAKHVIVGNIYDTETKTNLTEEKVRKINRVSWDVLPLDLAIKVVKGNGSRKLAVFSDADCPYCHRLENELKNITDVTIYTFLYPIDKLHPDAARKSAMIWCAADKVQAWNIFMETQQLPKNDGSCATPIAQLQQLGKKLKIHATPTLIFADGSLVPGALPHARLEADLIKAEAEARQPVATKIN